MDPREQDARERERLAERPTTGDALSRKVTAPVGAAAGALAGGTAGTLILGPIGTIVGAIAGAVGGGWAGLAGNQAIEYDDEADRRYRAHFERLPDRPADRGWDRVRPAYQLGHVARRNPDYAGRRFDEIEPDLRRGWSDDVTREHGDWTAARAHVRAAYEGILDEDDYQRRNLGKTVADLPTGAATAGGEHPSFNDAIPTYRDPVHSSTGQSVAGDVQAASSPATSDSVLDRNRQGGFGAPPDVPSLADTRNWEVERSEERERRSAVTPNMREMASGEISDPRTPDTHSLTSAGRGDEDYPRGALDSRERSTGTGDVHAPNRAQSGGVPDTRSTTEREEARDIASRD